MIPIPQVLRVHLRSENASARLGRQVSYGKKGLAAGMRGLLVWLCPVPFSDATRPRGDVMSLAAMRITVLLPVVSV